MKRKITGEGKSKKVKEDTDTDSDNEYQETKSKRNLTLVEKIVSASGLRAPNQGILWICEILPDVRAPRKSGIEMLKTFRNGGKSTKKLELERIFNEREEYELETVEFPRDNWILFLIFAKVYAIALIEKRKGVKFNRTILSDDIDDQDAVDDDDVIQGILKEHDLKIGLRMEDLTLDEQIDRIVEEKIEDHSTSLGSIETIFTNLEANILGSKSPFYELADLCHIIARIHTDTVSMVDLIWKGLDQNGFRTLYHIPRNGIDEYVKVAERIEQLNALYLLEISMDMKGVTIDRGRDFPPRSRPIKISNNLIIEYISFGGGAKVVFTYDLPETPREVLNLLEELESKKDGMILRVREFFREILSDPTRSMIDYLTSTTSDHDWDVMISKLMRREESIRQKEYNK